MSMKKKVCQGSRGRVGILLVVVLALGVLNGCVHVGPDYKAPEQETPDLWEQELIRGLAEGEAALQTWWTTFNDPVLNSLIERAVGGNLDLKEAFARVKEARAMRGVASGERYPDLNAGGSAAKIRESDDFDVVTKDSNRTDDFYDVGMDATWEIDFWGRISRSIESADANLQASVENYRDALVILYAEIALNYVEARTMQARIRFAEASVGTQRGTLSITKARLRAEISGELDVRQAELNLANTESIIPQLKTRLVQAVNRLGVLLGEFPYALHQELAPPAPIPQPPARVAVGVPAELLRQRPDIRRAERQLAAQTARIGVATADLYPRFSLSGAFAYSGTNGTDLLDWGRRKFLFGPSFRWNIFDGGRVRNRINVEKTRAEQALVRYEQTVLKAAEDVENSMVSYTQQSDRREILQRAVVAAGKSVELVKALYKAGLTDFQNVFDMERSHFEQQQAFAASEGLVTENLVRLYKALGGGWEPQPEKIVEEVKDQEDRGEPIF